MLKIWENSDAFASRHIGPTPSEAQEMLEGIGCSSMREMVEQIIPQTLLTSTPTALQAGLTENVALDTLHAMMSKNVVQKSMIGQGYYETITPPVILRNFFQNPGWYTAYTPYQAEISQGRLELLFHFQHMVMDLTGFDLANASLLDEATAAAEAMNMAKRITGCQRKAFFADEKLFPQTLAVLQTRAKYFDFTLIIGPARQALRHDVFGAIFQYPNCEGKLEHFHALFAELKEKNIITIAAADLLALVLLHSPASMGADIAIGSSQRFGVPMGFGGPHAAFFATREAYKRMVPGRIIGVSKDRHGRPALRMALQTREQHIRREKANSNICTSQVLLANMATLYAMYHGPLGLIHIAHRIHYLANLFKTALMHAGHQVRHDLLFDTVTFARPASFDTKEYNVAESEDQLSVNFSETSTLEDVKKLYTIFTGRSLAIVYSEQEHLEKYKSWYRQDKILQHTAFTAYHTETQMMRYLKTLENRDLSLTQTMIPLGSCTMKLNSAATLMPLSWSCVKDMHPMAPSTQTKGYQEMLHILQEQLKTLTGYDVISLQPNSGAQGEYAGLLAIRRYQESIGQAHRDICLIPKSAHGTNPATAQMMGLKSVTVECDEKGNVSVADLRAKLKVHEKQLSCLMVTYPSTHGVFEQAIQEIAEMVHQHGGQIYLDGANFNALMGYVKPAEIGADVMHLNLHKTFAIPHGGGGPGMGPIGAKKHLAPFLPDSRYAVSASAFGSASILTISWMFIAMMGGNGLKRAAEYALLNANYIAARLKKFYPIVYTGLNGYVAHECILDLRPIKAATGITEIDIAKRLIDYGFHAPTMSFPVPGTLMVEPTESEDKKELDRFIEAMIAIWHEAQKVAAKEWDPINNPLKNAPHTEEDLCTWDNPYPISIGCYPSSHTKIQKYWPFVNRIDEAFGDRQFSCSCAVMDT